LDLRPDQGMAQVTGEKEVLPQDKALQSDVIRQIVQRISMHTQGGQSKMVIHLKPEYLGNVHMQVLTENHQVTVRMMADSIGVKEIVEQNLQHLRAEMQHHGLEIQKFDVFVANDDGGWKSGQEQAGFRESLRQRKQRFDGGKAKVSGAKSISDVGLRKTDNPKNLNEIDYFA
jgi:flagellar hook-length control protein FliK